MVDIHYFANMVGYKENFVNWVDFLDSAMVMMNEMVVVTNLRMEIDFST